jgi:ATP-dependent metalloprotease FtsH
MIVKIYFKNADVSKGYVSNDMPLEYSSIKSKAKVIDLEIDPLDSDDIEKKVWKFLDNCITQTSNMQWIGVVESETEEPIATLRTDESRVGLAMSEFADTVQTKVMRELCMELGAYLMAKALDLAMASVTGTATAVADADDTTTAPTTASTTTAGDIDAIIDKIKKQSKADIVKPKETLADYVCDSTLKEELLEVKNFFENSATYATAGIRIPKGILFKGVPGTGKTYAARCIAGDVDCYFMTCTASSLQGMYIGSGAENIRNVFEGAKTLRKASGKGVIIFFDELDSLGSRESHSGGASGEEDRTLNQLLAELSGFEDVDGIMVLGATNYPERIDDALMRSGRFSRQITIGIPEEDERRNLVAYYFKKLKMNFDSDCTVEDVAALTKGLTPADISEIINEAGILAIRDKRDTLYIQDVNEAVNKVITKNIRKPDKDVTFHRIVAIHEIGHVIAEYLYGNSVSVKVTNYSYGDAGGFTQPGENSKGLTSERDYKAKVMSLLGGRAAEEVFFGEISTGASEDFARAKKMIRHFYETYHFEPYKHSELDQTVLDTLHEWYGICVASFKLAEIHYACEDLVDALVSERVLYTKDIAAILSKHPGIRTKAIVA